MISILVIAQDEDIDIIKCLESCQKTKATHQIILVIDEDMPYYLDVKEYGKKVRMDVLPKGVKEGRAAALNAGCSIAKYDLIISIDGGNSFMDNALDELISNVDDIHHVFYGNVLVNGNDEKKRVIPYLEIKKEQFLIQKPLFLTSLFKKKVFDKVKGFDKDKLKYTDYNFWAKIYKMGYKFKYSPINLYIHNERKNNILLQKFFKKAIDGIFINADKMVTNQTNDNDFFVQKIVDLNDKGSRDVYFEDICRDKNILHIGCGDYPFDNPEFHVLLSHVAKEIDGMDINEESIERCKELVRGNYFLDMKDIKGEYDIVLVPETIEHVDNIAIFLNELTQIRSKEFIITAPCIIHTALNKNMGYDGGDNWYEMVHPDHNCWYTPYTLKNVVEKYSGLKVEEVFMMENDHMIGVRCKPTL